MAENGRAFRIETVAGGPVRVGDVTVTPVAKTLIVRLPFFGFVWNRPVAALVERDGEITRLPVVDVTRLVQVTLIALSLAFAFVLRSRGSEGGEKS